MIEKPIKLYPTTVNLDHVEDLKSLDDIGYYSLFNMTILIDKLIDEVNSLREDVNKIMEKAWLKLIK